MPAMPDQPITWKQFFMAKFDNLALICVIWFLICMLTWIDKHGNSDYEKWLEVFTAGFGGSYLTLVTAARQALTTKNGNGNGAPPAQSIGIVPKTGGK